MGHCPSSGALELCAPVGPLRGVGVGVGVVVPRLLDEHETDWRIKSATKIGRERREIAFTRLI
jgi:hypothetical protein